MQQLGEFNCKPGLVFPCGCRVVVQTERGIELGEPAGAPSPGCGCELTVLHSRLSEYIKSSGQEFCRPRAGRILRVANEQDINEHNHLNANIREDVDHCAALVHQLGLDLKVVTAEHLLGGERIVFYFSAPTRVDFRQLVKELAQRYRTRIEMRQVGARDEARLVADYEVCGRECCCRNFLKKLRPVNMKMAKLQKSTLDPSKVSGRCGRLRCCLRYEHFGYEELAKRLPRVGSRVETEFGTGTIADRQILTQLLSVRLDDDRVMTIPLEEIKAFDLPPLPPKPESGIAATEPPGSREGSRQRRSRQRTRDRLPTEPRLPVAPSEPQPEPTAQSNFVPEPPVASGTQFAPTVTNAPDSKDRADTSAPESEPAVTKSESSGPRRRRRRHRRGRRGPNPPATEDPTPK